MADGPFVNGKPWNDRATLPPTVAHLQSVIAKALQHLECDVPEWYEGMQLLRAAVTKPADLYATVENAVRNADADIANTIRSAFETPARQPKQCAHENAEDAGECSQGCCDRYRCKDCGHTWTEEVAD
jgi:hypothetical protein